MHLKEYSQMSHPLPYSSNSLVTTSMTNTKKKGTSLNTQATVAALFKVWVHLTAMLFLLQERNQYLVVLSDQ